MISKAMSDALNKHMNFELYSAHIYLSMCSVANEMGLKGSANWFMAQYEEEILHFRKFFNYLVDQGINITLTASKAVPNKYKSLQDIFEKTLAHEQAVTKGINELMELAVQDKDHATQIFLQWFITEQLEEENTVQDIIAKLKLVGDKGHGLLMIDNELGSRTFTPPASGTAPFAIS